MNALQEQLLRDNLQVMNGGCVAIRGGRHVVHPRVGNTIGTDALTEAVKLGYAVVENDRHHTVRVTDKGWAFCGMA